MEYFLAFVGTFAIVHLYLSRRKIRTDLKKLTERVGILEARSQGDVTAAAPAPAEVEKVVSKSSAPPPPPAPKKEMAPPKAQSEIVTAPPAPVVPRPPAPPNPVFEAIRRFFTGGNLVVRIGLIVLFLGITFLLKLAVDQGLLPIELRLAAAALGAIALIGFGWRLRIKRSGYALSLLGGGIGLLYLVIFAAFRLYHLIPATFAFGLLLFVVAFSSFIAVVLQAQAVAVIGICGGFLAPILTSTGGGSHVALFSYFLLLNLGILGIAWFRAWRVLNVLGFFFTFTLGTAWGANYYRPELFSTTEPFLIAFFVLYSTIPILFASRVRSNLKGFVDTTLVFGSPLVGFALQIPLVKDTPHGLAWSSLALAVYYIGLSRILVKRAPETYRTLMEATLALGVVFVTLTIPLRLNHEWTSLSWAIEGAALVWIGFRQNRILARLFGFFILIGSCFAFREAPAEVRGLLLVNPYFIGGLFISLSSLFSSRLYSLKRDQIRKFEVPIPYLLFALGLGWWFYSGVMEIGDQMQVRQGTSNIPNAQLLFVILSLAACEALHRPLRWPLFRKPAYLLLPLLAIAFTVCAFDHGYHPFAHLGWIVWPVGLISQVWFLRRIEKPDLNFYQKLLHAGTLILFVEIASWESVWRFNHGFYDTFFNAETRGEGALDAGLTWLNVVGHSWGVLALVVVTYFRDKIRWPFQAQEKTYLNLGLTPIAFFLWIWIFRSLALNGASQLIPYVPLFNPLEILQGIFFLAAVAWLRSLNWRIKKFLYFLLGLTIFIWVNALLARSVSHWMGLPYAWSTLSDSLVFQTALTIYWAVLAMALMVIGTRKKMRGAWKIGASLLGLTVLKLFFADLSKTQTIARVVSFVGAGLLMLLIGYFSPLPPKKKKEEAAA